MKVSKEPTSEGHTWTDKSERNNVGEDCSCKLNAGHFEVFAEDVPDASASMVQKYVKLLANDGWWYTILPHILGAEHAILGWEKLVCNPVAGPEETWVSEELHCVSRFAGHSDRSFS